MTEDELRALERQVERGSLFTHTALGRAGLRMRELESFVFGLIDALVARDGITLDEIEDAARAARSQLDRGDEPPEPAVVIRRDPPATGEPAVEVDCSARMHVCHAVCCKLDFPLSGEEVEGGVIRWDLGRPYVIRHEPDGLCVHNDRDTGACGVYADRPRPCRRYSCATDDRIWKDFERMELNTEWIDANLSFAEPRLLHTMLAQRQADEPSQPRSAS
jgi:Fe-S-cluster containining protein